MGAKALGTLGAWLVGALVFAALSDVAMITADADRLGVLGRLVDGEDVPYREVVAADDRVTAAAVSRILFAVMAAALFVAWWRRRRSLGAWWLPILSVGALDAAAVVARLVAHPMRVEDQERVARLVLWGDAVALLAALVVIGCIVRSSALRCSAGAT